MLRATASCSLGDYKAMHNAASEAMDTVPVSAVAVALCGGACASFGDSRKRIAF
jgi:hypothetical protein